MGLFDSLKNFAADNLGNVLGGDFNLGSIGDLPAVIGEHQQVVGDHLNADRLDELQALAEENISADQISQVAGAIQEQGANLDLGSIAEQAGLPADIISQISGLLGK